MKEFDKIIGYKDIKIELERIIDILKNPAKYNKLGVKPTKGLLLHGEPGLGKTLMANCFIKASKRKAFVIKKNVPDGEFIKYITATFNEARAAAPSIVLLDDLDKYATEDNERSTAEEFSTVQACIDDCKEDDVFVIATVNRMNILPDSLLRPGRFDKIIEINSPTGKTAEEIVKYFLSTKKVAKDVDYKEIARILDGGSCAALETIINEAGIYSGFENKKEIDMKDILKAVMRVIYNSPEALDDEFNEFDRHTAIHEAGHAVVSDILEPGSVYLVSVEKHDRSCVEGITSLAQDDNYFKSMKYMENRVISILAGKAATELFFGEIDTGAECDLRRAFRIVARFADEYCGYGFNCWEGITDIKPASSVLENKTQMVQNKVEHYYQQAKKIIVANREYIEKLADELVDKRTLLSSDVKRIRMECVKA